MTLLEKDKKYVWHPFTQAKTASSPLPIVRAKDAWLYAEDGKRYLDANSSWWTVLHGHGNEEIATALSQQFKTLDHAIFAGATHPKAVEIAEKIVTALPKGLDKVFFSDNGSTSVEVAIKMTYQYWSNQGIEKKRFLALEGAYHGDTFGAMSVGQRGYFNKPFEHLFFDVDYLPFPTEENYQDVLVQAKRLFSTGEFAGFIFEPIVQGAAGMRIYEASVLDDLIRLAKRNNVLCLADEVMTGFYRTGKLFAIEYLKEKVDIICLSKGLTGGILPLGLTVASQDIFDAFLSDDTAKALLHGHSFTGNALSCATSCASFDLLQKTETKNRIAEIATKQKAFADEMRELPYLKSAKSIGTILSLEIDNAEESSYFSSIRDEAYAFFLSKEILIRPLGNVLFMNPPYCVTNAELDMVYEAIRDFLNLKFGAKKIPLS